MSAEESSWSEGRGRNEQDEKERELARKRALEAYAGVNSLLRKFADDEDLHEDLKQPEVKVAVKHWTGEKRLDTETAAKLFSRENYRVMSVLQKIRILQAECQKAGLLVPLDHVLRRESELRLPGAAAGERTEQKPSAASKAMDKKKKKAEKTEKGRAAVKPDTTSAEAASTPSTGEAPGQSSGRTGVKGAAARKGSDRVKPAEEGVDLAVGRSRGVLSLLSTLIVPLLSTVVAFLLTIWLLPQSQSKSGGQEDMAPKRRSSSGGGPPASPATPQSGRVGERTRNSGKKDGKGRSAGGGEVSTPGPIDVTLRIARSDAAAPGRLLMVATDMRKHGLRAGDWVIVVEQQSASQTLDDRHMDDTASGRLGLVILRAWPSTSLPQGTVLGSAPMVPAQFPAITSSAGAAVVIRPLSNYIPAQSDRSVVHTAAMVTIRRDSKSSMSDVFFRERLRELLTGLIVFKGLRLAITLFMQSYHFQITEFAAHDRAAHHTALGAAADLAATLGGGAALDVSEDRGCQVEERGGLEASMSRLALDETEREMELPQLYYFGREASVRLVDSAAGASTEPGQHQVAPPIEDDPWSIVGGLDRQIKEVKDGLQLPLSSSDVFAQHGLKPTRGLLLTGPPGTGKSLLIQAAVAHFCRQGVHTMLLRGSDMVSRLVGETEGRLRAAFAEARARAPTLLVMDDVEALGPKRDSGSSDSGRVVSTLLALMDGFDAMEKVVVLGATNKPAALDPALRRPGRFDSEIDIGVPGEDARRDILHVLLRRAGRGMAAPPQTLSAEDKGMDPTTPPDGESTSNGWIRISDEAIAGVAARAHGFVGADLMLLCKEAAMGSMRRRTAGGGSMTMEQSCITDEDLWAALKRVRPSALREVAVEVPRVHWTDIGGQESVKQALKECVEWPLRHPEAFARMGISPPKGVLMYGPPGCSKTLMARALATESGMNFLAVKGPELLSKWLGESERALQSLFKRARSAAPTVIFFDEIDALAGRRGQGDDSKASERVLSQLLTELDGVQPLRRVVVIAATNRPDLIDPALLRPGRLDRKVYVPPPDLPSRAEILRIALKGVPVEDGAIDFDAIARASEGMSGAEVVAVCREASLMAIEEDPENAAYVRQDHLEKAVRGWKRQITPEVIEFYQSFSARRS